MVRSIFLHVDKNQSFLEVDIFLIGMPKVPKIKSLQYLSNVSRKR